MGVKLGLSHEGQNQRLWEFGEQGAVDNFWTYGEGNNSRKQNGEELQNLHLWLRCYAASRKVTGSRPDEVNF
jgi:hypothetical protein